jgi:Spy/CpxP family protein refolding chaperone
MGFKIPNFAKQMGGSPFAMKSPLNKGDGAEISKSQEEKPKGPDWSKAPKNNTQARRDWYTKNKLKQDETTKVKSDTDTKPSSETTTTSNNSSSDSKDSKEIKVKTRKEKRSARRADRLKAKAKSKGSLTPGQKKRLERNEAKAKGEKPEKTKVGKALKSVVDKAKDLVSKDSPAQRNEGESHFSRKNREARRKMDKNKEQK